MNDINDPSILLEKLWYFGIVMVLGAIAAFTAFVTSKEEMTWRATLAYVFSGSLSALGLTLLMAEKYGFSYFLIGISIFVAYKAVPFMNSVSGLIGPIVKRVFDGVFNTGQKEDSRPKRQSPKKKPDVIDEDEESDDPDKKNPTNNS